MLLYTWQEAGKEGRLILSSGAKYNQINFSKNHVSGNARKIGVTFIWWFTIRTIKATIAVGKDSVAIFGLHMASNNYDICTIDEIDSENDNNSRYARYKEAQKYRCFQAEWTKYAVLNSQHPVIVMGDMNDINGSSPLNIFKNSGLLDTWWEGGFGYGATFHEGWLRLRIDHIYYNDKLKLKEVKVVETDLSDHNILVASFVFAN